MGYQNIKSHEEKTSIMQQFKNGGYHTFNQIIFKWLIVFLLFSSQLTISAQKKRHEIGAFLGAAYYMGELNTTRLFYSPSPTFGFLYRYDLNARYAVKLTGTFANLQGNDAKSKNLYQQQRDEYYTFYVTAGVGVMYMQSKSNTPIHAVIPFGLGFKYGVTKRVVITAEWTYRKTFTDFIDQLEPDEYSLTSVPTDKQQSYNYSKDWYSFAGITFTYKFALGSNSCPAYGNLSK
ncbi:MAG: hypothetical protein B6I20_09535 [Bacteroidetes bacterium 4572_117]|nr:MAG: hypothetical protein B6I20_09535 [Bacteroidetes bacterium 4572_117]